MAPQPRSPHSAAHHHPAPAPVASRPAPSAASRVLRIMTPGYWPLPRFERVAFLDPSSPPSAPAPWVRLKPLSLGEKDAQYLLAPQGRTGRPAPLIVLEAAICRALPKKIRLSIGARRFVLSRWMGGLYSNLRPRTLAHSRAFYDAIAPRYAWHTEPTRADQLRAFVPHIPSGSKVLDASAGDCRFARAAEGRFDLWCSDISRNMLALGMKSKPPLGLPADRFIVASASRPPFPPASFDAVVHTFSNVHALDRRFFRSFHRILRPGGLLLYHPVKAAGEQWPRAFEQKTRAALAAAGFGGVERKSAYAPGKKKTTLVFYLARKPER